MGYRSPQDFVVSAETAGLRYMTDAEPGIGRRRAGRGFSYISPDGQVIREREHIQRFRALVIPPAWRDVWICPSPDGHLQVTARDVRGRKQYRYHPNFRARRDEAKFERMVELSTVLGKVRARVERDIALDGLPKKRVMATIVWLLERTLIRVGSHELTKANNSFGLTTLRRRHVSVDGATLLFEFRGKSGVEHSVSVQDRRIARIVQRCRELPGRELFQYLDARGRRQIVYADDVNSYLRRISGRDITAKDFRTWMGTMLAADALREMGPASSRRDAEQNIVSAIDQTAARLGNTRSVCRKYYIHPVLLQAYLEGDVLPPRLERTWQDRQPHGPTLRRHEAEVLAFLRARVRSGPEAAR
jgi:DNA topoisomerase I